MNGTCRLIPALCAVATLAAGCCGTYKDRLAGLEDANAALASENVDLQTAIEELEARIASIAAYQEALESELLAQGLDKSLLSKKHAEAQEDLAAAQEDILAKQAKLEATRKSLESSQAELDATLADLENKSALLEELKKKQDQAKSRLATLKDMLTRFKSLIDAGKLEVKVRKNRMIIQMPSEILFSSGSDKLSKQGKEMLAEVAVVISTIDGREFQVAGHTDDEPKKVMKFKDNWELSTARALSVLKFLLESGVPASVLSATGYGQQQPVAGNDTEQGRAKNRRIEIVLVPNLDELPDLSQLEKELGK